MTSHHGPNSYGYCDAANRGSLVVTNPSMSATSTVTGDLPKEHFPYLSRQQANQHTLLCSGALAPSTSTPSTLTPPSPTHQVKEVRRQRITPLYHAPPETWNNPPTFPPRTSEDEWPINGNPISQLESGSAAVRNAKSWYRRCWVISLFVAFLLLAAVAISAAMVVRHMAALVSSGSEQLLAD